MENFQVDPEAKTKIPLIKATDNNGNNYYHGKIQFPGTMEFEGGISFMVFIADDGAEELQIAPLDPMKKNRSRGTASLVNGRLAINIHPIKDQHDNTYYIGEAIGPIVMKLNEGIFITVFTSIPGQEQIQVCRLQHKPRKSFERGNTFDLKTLE